jgi:hypothetical protein
MSPTLSAYSPQPRRTGSMDGDVAPAGSASQGRTVAADFRSGRVRVRLPVAPEIAKGAREFARRPRASNHSTAFELMVGSHGKRLESHCGEGSKANLLAEATARLAFKGLCRVIAPAKCQPSGSALRASGPPYKRERATDVVGRCGRVFGKNLNGSIVDQR